MTANAHKLRRKLPALAGGGFLLLFTVVVVWLVKDFIDSAGKPEPPRVQQISLVKPPPPKEPPKPPEPEKVEKVKDEVKLDQPEPEPQDAPPPGGVPDGPPGGMATDLARGSGFGAGSREAWYGKLISRHFEDVLRRDKRLHGKTYTVTLLIWFDAGGEIKQVQLVSGSGKEETDATLRQAILGMPALREVLPPDLPQPIRISIASRE
ncbi:MAG: energy transducer TonB [Hydrogenophilaceae bacterium]|nr:energy transducer TonB [Hydrogenophilaceae bacterium]